MNHLKLFSIRQTEKLARFFGLLSTIFIISIILLIVVLFFSFALAGVLNNLLNTSVWGYLAVSGLYIMVILIILMNMRKTKKPLLSNTIAKSIARVFDIEEDRPLDLAGLEIEKELLREKISSNKDKFDISLQLLRYSLMEYLFKEFFGLFKSKNDDSVEIKEDSEEKADEKKKEK
jgi:hypothetical protein